MKHTPPKNKNIYIENCELGKSQECETRVFRQRDWHVQMSKRGRREHCTFEEERFHGLCENVLISDFLVTLKVF